MWLAAIAPREWFVLENEQRIGFQCRRNEKPFPLANEGRISALEAGFTRDSELSFSRSYFFWLQRDFCRCNRG
ncbi:MAG TPA: hypothetical protein VIW73_02725, partial [Candidatus Cybelea sp.]